MKFDVHIDGARRSVELISAADEISQVTVVVDGRRVTADIAAVAPDAYSILIAGRSFEVRTEMAADGLVVQAGNREFRVQILDPRSWRGGRTGGIELEGRQEIAASMPGKIVRSLVTAGQQVEAGQGLLVVEAMKMQNEIRSPKSGTVERIAREGQTVNVGEILAIVT